MLLGSRSVLNKSSGTFLAGVGQAGNRSNFGKRGQRLARITLGLSEWPSTSNSPEGMLPPLSWGLPLDGGSMSSFQEGSLIASGEATLEAGLPTSGSTNVAMTLTGVGGLVVSGSGSTTIAITSTGGLISTASANGTVTVSLTPSATIKAIGLLNGPITVTMTPSATILGAGLMEGLSTNETEFSANSLASAVWSALAASYNESGTMGAKLNSASAAGDPWTADLPGTYSGSQAGKIVGSKLLTIAKFLALKD